MSTATTSPPTSSQQTDICEDPGEALLAADEAIQNSRDPFPELTLGDAMPRCESDSAPKGTYVDPPSPSPADGGST